MPVIFVMVPYFQKYELEGPNITGIALTSDLTLELDAVKAMMPKVKRVGVVEDPRYSQKFVEDAAHARQRQGADPGAAGARRARAASTRLLAAARRGRSTRW